MVGIEQRKLGGANLTVSSLGYGAAPIGNQPDPLPDNQCRDSVIAAYMSGIRYFDTSPAYGRGLSERLLGDGLRKIGRPDIVLSTKVGRYQLGDPNAVVPPGSRSLRMKTVLDYSYDGAMRSIEQSYQRLGLGSIDIVHIHDVDVKTHGTQEAYEARFREAMEGAYPALVKLRSEGVIKAIGIGIHEIEPSLRFLAEGDFDCVMLSGHYTLLEQTAAPDLIPALTRKGVSLLVGGPFASGILATGARAGATFKYREAPSEVMETVKNIERICASYGVPLTAAALQFCAAHPVVASVVTGAVSGDQVVANADAFSFSIPDAFWAALKDEKILPSDAVTP